MPETIQPALLLEYIKPMVSARIRSRGEAYAAQGAVVRLAVDDFGLRAEVRGSELYTVTMRYDGSLDGTDSDEPLWIRAACGCPFFEQADICKHIWATLVAAGRLLGERLPAVSEQAGVVLEGDPDLALKSPRAPMAVGRPVLFEHGERVAQGNATSTDTPDMPRARRRRRPPVEQRVAEDAAIASAPDWESAMGAVAMWNTPGWDEAAGPVEPFPADQQIVYVLDFGRAANAGDLAVEPMVRWRKRDGAWSQPRSRRIDSRQVAHLPDPDDRQLLTLLGGSPSEVDVWMPDLPDAFELTPPVQATLTERLCRTGRCFTRSADGSLSDEPLHWRDEPAWRLWLVAEDLGRSGCIVRGELRQQTEEAAEPRRMPVTEPDLLTRGGLLFIENTVSRYQHDGGAAWADVLRETGMVRVRPGELETMLEHALTRPAMPPIELPDRLAVKRERGTPQPYLRIRRPDSGQRNAKLEAALVFQYGERTVTDTTEATGFYQKPGRLIERDLERERQARQWLSEIGFIPAGTEQDPGRLLIGSRDVPAAVAMLVQDGWLVEAEGQLHRAASGINMDFRASGIDWFELHGEATFGEESVTLPRLLQALRKGENYVRLDDGSVGILPEDWLKRYGALAGLSAQAENGHVRLAATQIGLIDALLTQMPEVDFDEQIAAARERLAGLGRITPRNAPRGFRGELRAYQQDGLGWLHFLRKIGFGGCLADDMGLGKTIQVLALLESRRQQRRRDTDETPPSIVVAPRSLVHNWQAEAARFTPKLRVLDHTGPDRFSIDGDAKADDPLAHFAGYDLVLTTYGTLRQDIAMLRKVAFDYVVLDEAQAIKNASTASAKAARLLNGANRLALSGTPIENHLGELVSLFSFLNPGMLGDPEAWTNRSGAAARTDAADADQCGLLARAVKPFLLRRTKEQVAADLPEKTEQTLYCDLPDKQQALYNELRDYYNAQVMGKVQSRGLNQSKIDVLQALLRLRQAACHPGLIDKSRAEESSAKLKALLPQIEELVEEGHKALVFSQFTSFLSLVRKQLEKRGIDYAYIDGRTRKRQQAVERFQEDPDCPLFLISLKAGGTGLNLTAADYVFLLDPWWNPAVEAQAIDRTHRIGQDKRVHAYRLIAAGTVEEKVLALQQTKRDLADAIVRADANLIRELSMDDLRYLLS